MIITFVSTPSGRTSPVAQRNNTTHGKRRRDGDPERRDGQDGGHRVDTVGRQLENPDHRTSEGQTILQTMALPAIACAAHRLHYRLYGRISDRHYHPVATNQPVLERRYRHCWLCHLHLSSITTFVSTTVSNPTKPLRYPATLRASPRRRAQKYCQGDQKRFGQMQTNPTRHETNREGGP
jgi:hypothetical protein